MWLVTVAWTFVANYWLFDRHALAVVVAATHGLIGRTLVAHLIEGAIVIGGVLIACAGARAAELGLRRGAVLPAAATTLGVWIALNVAAMLAALAAGSDIELAAGWRSPGHALGELFGQLFGNAPFEEIVFRGVLVVQLARWIEGGTSPPSRRTLLVSLLVSQTIFALGHIPNRLAARTWEEPVDALLDLARVWCNGIGLALVWLRTRNLLIAVGLHALSNTATLVVSSPAWVTGLGVPLAFAILVMRGETFTSTFGHWLRRRGALGDRTPSERTSEHPSRR